jgi:hypothetical protein
MQHSCSRTQRPPRHPRPDARALRGAALPPPPQPRGRIGARLRRRGGAAALLAAARAPRALGGAGGAQTAALAQALHYALHQAHRPPAVLRLLGHARGRGRGAAGPRGRGRGRGRGRAPRRRRQAVQALAQHGDQVVDPDLVRGRVAAVRAVLAALQSAAPHKAWACGSSRPITVSGRKKRSRALHKSRLTGSLVRRAVLLSLRRQQR